MLSSVGYLFTAEVIKTIGFPHLILGIGIINVIYGMIVFVGEFTFLVNVYYF